MRPLLQFHDGVLLRFLQEDVYGHQAIWAGVLFVLLLCLPTHRTAARIVGWCVVVWAIVCILFYGALTEAPWLGWFLVAVLAYRLARWLFWTLPLAGENKSANRSGWLGIPGGWTTAIVRDYLRADPRAVYWLDLARAVRGMPPRRSPRERRAALMSTPELPEWRRAIWLAFFRLVDLRIGVYRRLPGYWHLPHMRLDLGEDHLNHVLEDESERTYQNMLRSWTGDDFTEYCNRDPRTRRREERRAAGFGRASCLLREALAECRTFREPWQAGEPLLLDATVLSYLTWRRRQQHAGLWHSGSNGTSRIVEPEPNDVSSETLPAAEPAGDPAEPAPELDVVVRLDGDSTGEPSPETATVSPEAGSAAPDDDGPSATEDSEAASGEDGPFVDRLAIVRELLGPAPEAAEPEEDENDLSDDQLFDVAVPEPAPEAPSETAGSSGRGTAGLSSRAEEELADLQTGSRMLEAFLGVEASGEFAKDVEQVERFLGQPKRRLAAAMLLMFYCLRSDYSGAGVDGQKVETLARLDEQLFSREVYSQQSPAERRLLRSMQIDVMFQRREYARVVELLSRYDDPGKYECQVLANAETAVAEHLTGQDELRDMLRYDAIGHYFRGGFRGIWTLEYAGRLVDHLTSADQLLDLFHDHPVEIGRPASLAPAASQRKAAVSATRTLQVRLAPAKNPSKGRLVSIDRLPCSLGGTQQANICLAGMQLADVHVVLEEVAGGLTARDVSRRGMRINGKQLKAARLKKGDAVQFGAVMMKIETL